MQVSTFLDVSLSFLYPDLGSQTRTHLSVRNVPALPLIAFLNVLGLNFHI